LPGNLYLTEMLEAQSTICTDDPVGQSASTTNTAPDTPAPPPRGYVDQQDNM
jgi:hypothetical protein